MKEQAIFITGAERSGSTLIARIFDMCGAFKGTTTSMYENIEMKNLCDTYLLEANIQHDMFIPETRTLSIPVDWKQRVDSILYGCECFKKGGAWFFKYSGIAQMWPVWNYAYPDAKWIIVRRRTGDVVQSCVKTAYMSLFKQENNLEKIGVSTQEEGWKWWIHQYEKKFVEMLEAGVNAKVIWPERMVTGDYGQIYEMLDWVGLRWNPKIIEMIDPLLNKSRRKDYGKGNSG
jgi:hypothetical protein